MSMNSRNASSARVCVEPLEARRLMSAVPLVGGDVFTGTATPTQSNQASPSAVTLTIATETKTGKLTGTLVVDDASSNSPTTFIVKGSVNKHSAFILKAVGPKDEVAKLTGTFSADTTTVVGKYVSHRPKHHGDSGTFVASRA